MPDMELGQGFLTTANKLLPDDLTQSPQADLRRAVSACYYAVFHSLAKACADALVGDDRENRSNKAWVEVYRGLDHGKCYSACEGSGRVGFPEGLKIFAQDFMQLQVARQRADYDPMARIDGIQALAFIGVAVGCITTLTNVQRIDMTAFATWLIITSKGAEHARKLVKEGAHRNIIAPARNQ